MGTLPGAGGGWLDYKLTLPQLVSALVFVVGVAFWAGGFSTRTDSTQTSLATMATQVTGLKADMISNIASLRTDMTSQLSQIQSGNTKQFDQVRADIANIPGMKERIDQVTRQQDQAESRFDAQARRLDATAAITIQNQSDIAGVIRTITLLQQSRGR